MNEKLINQKVVLTSDNSELTIVEVVPGSGARDLKVTFDNGRTFNLSLALVNNVIVFKDKNVQKEFLESINEFDNKQKEIEERRVAANKKAIEENKRKAALEPKKQPVRGRRVVDPNIRKDRKNAAYKATYCDGNGDWFKAPCSIECRKRNCSRTGGKFCRTNSMCKRVIDGLSSEADVLDCYNNSFLCYESRIFIDYKIYAGLNDDGSSRGWNLDKDRLVVLTTIKPGEKEIDRVIFGAFLIDRSYDKYDEKEAYATSYPDCRIVLTKEEADKMRYWEYAPGEGNGTIIQWKENLLRYQSDETCATILKDLVKIIEKRKDPVQSAYARAFLHKFLGLIKKSEEDIPEKCGARIKEQKLDF